MAALFARLWLSRSVTDPVGLTVAKPFRTNDALMFVKGVGWRFGGHGSGVVGWCSDRVVAGLRTRQGWASVMARKLLLGHASRSAGSRQPNIGSGRPRGFER